MTIIDWLEGPHYLPGNPTTHFHRENVRPFLFLVTVAANNYTSHQSITFTSCVNLQETDHHDQAFQWTNTSVFWSWTALTDPLHLEEYRWVWGGCWTAMQVHKVSIQCQCCPNNPFPPSSWYSWSHYILSGNMWNHFFVLTGIVERNEDMLSRCAFSDSLDSSSSTPEGCCSTILILVCHHHHSFPPLPPPPLSKQFLAQQHCQDSPIWTQSPWWHVLADLQDILCLCSSGRMNLCGLPLCMDRPLFFKPFGKTCQVWFAAQGPQSCCNAAAGCSFSHFWRNFWSHSSFFFLIKVCNSSSLFTSSPSSTDSWEKDDPDHELWLDRVPKRVVTFGMGTCWDSFFSGGSPLILWMMRRLV